MNLAEATRWLDAAWDLERDVFFYKLRQGSFVESEFEDLKQVLRATELPIDGRLNTEFVTLVWMIPLFMIWQTERVVESGFDKTST